MKVILASIVSILLFIAIPAQAGDDHLQQLAQNELANQMSDMIESVNLEEVRNQLGNLRHVDESHRRQQQSILCDGIVGAFVGGEISCSCTLSLFPLGLNFKCNLNACLTAQYCAKTVYKGALTLAPNSLKNNICVNNANIVFFGQNVRVAKFCVDIVSRTGDLSKFKSCKATAGSTTCNKCEICGDQRSVSVDCKNAVRELGIIAPNATFSCVGLKTITSARMPKDSLNATDVMFPFLKSDYYN